MNKINFMQNNTINGFTLQRLLGVGGMAEVWCAKNEIYKRAAVKTTRNSPCSAHGHRRARE